MFSYIFFFIVFFVNYVFASETNIDFNAVDITGEKIGPSLQLVVEGRRSSTFDPYTFHELCFESNEVIKRNNNSSLRLREGTGIIHESPLLQDGKYKTCIMNNIGSDKIHMNYIWNVNTSKKNGMRVSDEPSDRITDCENGAIRVDPFGRKSITKVQTDCKTKDLGKMQDMFFEGFTSFNVTLLYPDLEQLDKNIFHNHKKNIRSKYCGTIKNKDYCSYELPKLAVVRLDRVEDDKVVYIGFDKNSVDIKREYILFDMNEQSWLFYMEKIE